MIPPELYSIHSPFTHKIDLPSQALSHPSTRFAYKDRLDDARRKNEERKGDEKGTYLIDWFYT